MLVLRDKLSNVICAKKVAKMMEANPMILLSTLTVSTITLSVFIRWVQNLFRDFLVAPTPKIR
ncbi:hypothetical protein ACOMICROBIO_GDFFDHBD_00722 [Vibrio sp. B1REV9]|nr:hypothetical protein ACOMICROBIO_GDFFDHBD_00722 [Vibrio sp. B1REV9]